MFSAGSAPHIGIADVIVDLVSTGSTLRVNGLREIATVFESTSRLISAPAIGELIAAAPGASCWWNGSRCSVSAVDEMARATVLTTDDRFRERPGLRAGWERVANAAAVSRTGGRLLRLSPRRHRPAMRCST